MKSNLEETIAYYQKIVDHLQSQMDDSIAEFDFDSAKAIKNPLFHAKAKLKVLQDLKNPNHSKVMSLKALIDQIETGAYYRRFDFSGLNIYPEIKERQKQLFKERTEKRLQKAKEDLKNLLSIPIQDSIDDDQLVVFLEKIILNEIRKFDLEIKPEKVYLEVKPVDNFIVLKPFTKTDYPVEDYYYGNSLGKVLSHLGFEQIGEDYILKKNIADIRGIIEVLAVLMFEIFRVRSDTRMNVIIYE